MTSETFLVIWIVVFGLCAVLFQAGFVFLMYGLGKTAALQIKWKRNDADKYKYYTEKLYGDWLYFFKLSRDEPFRDDHDEIKKIYAVFRKTVVLMSASIVCFLIAAYMQGV